MDKRHNRVKNLLAEEELDGILVLSPANRRYLSGFTGTAGCLLITNAVYLILADSRYTEQAKKQCSRFKVIQIQENIWDSLNGVLKDYKVKNVGFEDGFVTCRQYGRMTEKLDGAYLVPLGDRLDKIRMVKDREEIENIRTAARICERALLHVKPLVKPGTVEKDISLELEFYIRRAGCSGPAFEFIVASGPRSALPHGTAGSRRIRDGDLVVIDLGGKYNGYCSDMTRTFVVGRPNPKQKEIYDTVLIAQTLALNGIKAGMTASGADGIAREIIERAGYGEYFGHGLGHGVGLQIHEAPTLNQRCDTVLEPGMVVTVEPGIYVPDFGGVRIEDLVMVAEDGIENLNSADKELTYF